MSLPSLHLRPGPSYWESLASLPVRRRQILVPVLVPKSAFGLALSLPCPLAYLAQPAIFVIQQVLGTLCKCVGHICGILGWVVGAHKKWSSLRKGEARFDGGLCINSRKLELGTFRVCSWAGSFAFHSLFSSLKQDLLRLAASVAKSGVGLACITSACGSFTDCQCVGAGEGEEFWCSRSISPVVQNSRGA